MIVSLESGKCSLITFCNIKFFMYIAKDTYEMLHQLWLPFPEFRLALNFLTRYKFQSLTFVSKQTHSIVFREMEENTYALLKWSQKISGLCVPVKPQKWYIQFVCPVWNIFFSPVRASQSPCTSYDVYNEVYTQITFPRCQISTK